MIAAEPEGADAGTGVLVFRVWVEQGDPVPRALLLRTLDISTERPSRLLAYGEAQITGLVLEYLRDFVAHPP